jgi:hypothetical protein
MDGGTTWVDVPTPTGTPLPATTSVTVAMTVGGSYIPKLRSMVNSIPSAPVSAASPVIVPATKPTTPTVTVQGNVVVITNTDSPVQNGVQYSYVVTTNGVDSPPVTFTGGSASIPAVPNTTYSVRVIATNTGTATSTPVSVTLPPATPVAPTLTATGSTTFTVTNNDTQSGCTYNYTVSPSFGLTTPPFVGNTATVTGASANTPYTVLLTVTSNADNTKVASITATVTTLPPPLTPPTLTATGSTAFTITNPNTRAGTTFSYAVSPPTGLTTPGFTGNTATVTGASGNTVYTVTLIATPTTGTQQTVTATVTTPLGALIAPTLAVSGGTGFTVTNNDSQVGTTYTYAVSPLLGLTTPLFVGNTATVTGASPNTVYTVTLTATPATGTPQTVTATVTIPIGTPVAPTLTATGSTGFTVLNNDNQPGTTYTYSVSPLTGLTSSAFVGNTGTVTGASSNTLYTVTLTATPTSGAAKTVTATLTTPIATPVAPTLTTTGSTGFTVKNNDNQPGVTYSYSVSPPTGLTTPPFVGTTATVTGASSNTLYTVTLTATSNADNTKVASTTATVTTPLGALIAPTLAVSGSTGFTVTNNDSQVGTTYTYAVSPLLGLTTPLFVGNTATVTGASPNTVYTVTLTATPATGTPQTITATVTIPIGTPVAPTLTATGSTGFTVLNNDNQPGTTYTYSVSPLTGLTSSAFVGNTATVTGASSNTLYTVTLTATPTSGAAKTVTATVTTPIATPVAPTLTATGSTGFTVLNNDSQAGVTYSYSVSPPTGLTTGAFVGNTGTVTGASSNTLYTVTLTATSNADNTKVASTTATVTTPLGTPVAPTLTANGTTGFTVTNNDSQVGTTYTYTVSPSVGLTRAPFSGNTAVVTGTSSNTLYTVTLTATPTSGAAQTVTASLTTPLAIPVAPTLTATGSTGFTVKNNDTQSGTTYSYAVSPPTGLTQGPFVGTTGTVTGALTNTLYTVTLTATPATGTPQTVTATLTIPIGTPVAPTLTAVGSTGFTVLNNDNQPGTTYSYAVSPLAGLTQGAFVGNTATVTGASSNTLYTVTLTATPTTGTPQTVTATITTRVEIPVAPTLTATGSTGFTVLNNDSQPGVTYSYAVSPSTGLTQGALVGNTGTVTGASSNTLYTVTLTATPTSGPLKSVTATLTTPIATPVAPTLTTTGSTGFTVLNNDSQAGVTYSYAVSPSTGLTQAAFVGNTGTVTGASANTLYTVTLTATSNADNTKFASRTATVTTPIAIPVAPTLTAVGSTGFTVLNNDSQPGVTYSYAVSPLTGLTSGAFVGNTATVTGVSSNTLYTVTLTATPATGTAQIVTATLRTLPATPSKPTITSVTSSGFTLTNTDTQVGCTYAYTISPSAGLTTPVFSGNTAIITGASANTVYTLTLTATNAGGQATVGGVYASTSTSVPTVPVTPSVYTTGTTMTITNNDSQPGSWYTYSVGEKPYNGTVIPFLTNQPFTNPTTYTIVSGKVYAVTITANNSKGTATSVVAIGGFDNSFTLSAGTPLPSLSTPTISISGTSMTVSYSGTVDTANYSYYSSIISPELGIWATSSVTSFPVTQSGLQKGRSYSAFIFYTNKTGAQYYSSSASPAYQLVSLVTTPVVPTLTATGSTAFTVTNNDAQSGCTYAYTVSPLAGLTLGAFVGNTATVTSASGNTLYTVTLTATSTVDNTQFASTTATLTTLPVIPTTPTLAQTAVGTLTLSGIDTNTAYTYSYSLNSGAYVAIPGYPSSILLTTGLVVGTMYSVTIKATNISGSSISAASNQVRLVSPPVTPTLPTITSVTSSGFTITNTDNQAGCTYSYTVSPSAGLTTPVFSTNTASVTNALPNTAYTVTLIATPPFGSAVSVTTAPITTLIYNMQLTSPPNITAYGNIITITNTDTQPGVTSYRYIIKDGLNNTTIVPDSAYTGPVTYVGNPGSTYQITITAIGAFGEIPSVPVSTSIYQQTTNTSTPPPIPPTPSISMSGTTLTATLPTSFTNAMDNTKYNYYYALSQANYQILGRAQFSTSSIVNNTPSASQSYTIFITVIDKATNLASSSASPAYINYAPPTIPSTPTLTANTTTLTLTNTDTQLKCIYMYTLTRNGVMVGIPTVFTGSIQITGEANGVYSVTVRAINGGGSAVSLPATASTIAGLVLTTANAQLYDMTIADGAYYTVGFRTHAVYKVTDSTPYAVFAGTEFTAGNVDGTSNTRFNTPTCIAYDGSRYLFVFDRDTHILRRIDTLSPYTVTTVAGRSGIFSNVDGPAGTGTFHSVYGMCIVGGAFIYVTDYATSTIRIVDIFNNYTITRVAGNGSTGNVDGPGSTAVLYQPRSMCYDGSQYIYFTEQGGHRIRRMSVSSPYTVTTIAGAYPSPGAGYQDSTGSNSRFNTPMGICYDGSRYLYVTDSGNYVVRRIDTQAPYTVTTVAGTAGTTGNSGITKGSYLFSNQLYGCYYDTATNKLFVVDSGNNSIRNIIL